MTKYLGRDKLRLGDEVVTSTTGHWLPAAAGIDVHKRMLVATVLIADFGESALTRHVRKFETSRTGLAELRDWLCTFKVNGLDRYGIEATSTYYRPVEYSLRDDFAQVLINPYLLKEARKTDAKDSRTIAYVVLTGLFQPNYVLPEVVNHLRTLMRRYHKAVGKRTASNNAMETVLTNYNVTLAREIALSSTSGQQILTAIVNGGEDAVAVASTATYYNSDNPARAAKREDIIASLGDLTLLPHAARIAIAQLLADYKHADAAADLYINQALDLLPSLRKIEPDTGEILMTGEDALELLVTLPGGNIKFALTLISELGIDMARFPTPGNLVSYCGLSPEKRVSADRVTSASPALRGNSYVRPMAVQVAQGLMQASKSSPLGTWGRAHRARNGNTTAAHNRAVAAVAKRLITSVWHILSTAKPYSDDGYDYTANTTNATKATTKLARHANELATTLRATDLDDRGRAILLNSLTSLAALAGITSTTLSIVPGRADASIDTLNLPTRLTNVLHSANISLVSGVCYAWATGTLSSVPGIGERSVQAITVALIEAGYLAG